MFGWFQVLILSYFDSFNIMGCWNLCGTDHEVGINFCRSAWNRHSLFCLLSYNLLSANWVFFRSICNIKLIPLFAIAIGGLIFGDPISAITNPTPKQFATKTLGWAAAIGPIAFSFDGWVISTAIAHEVRDSKECQSVGISSIICIGCLFDVLSRITGYLGVEQVIEMGDSAVAVAANNLLGSAFASIIYVFVTISVMGTLNGIILGYIRLPYSLALRNAIPLSDSIKKIHPKINMPVNSAFFAIAVSGIWWVIHYLQYKYSLLINGDIAEIAIAMSYLLYIILYYQVFRL